MARWHPRVRQRRYEDRRYRGGFPVALSEGDSWFDYPMYHNIIDYFDDAELFAHYRLETSGDTLKNMIADVDDLQAVVRHKGPLCVLFSAGGNDLADWASGKRAGGPLFKASSGEDPASYFHSDAWHALFSQIEADYRSLIQSVGVLAPIFAHGYDYFAPSSKPVRFSGVGIGVGPWVHPGLMDAEITNLDLQRKVAAYLVDQFNTLLAALSREYPRDFVYVNLRGTLDIDSDWENEIHPTEGGFRELARRYIDAVRRKLPGLLYERNNARMEPA